MTRPAMSSRLRLSAIPALTLATALVLTGCGSAEEEAETSPSPTVEQSAQTPEPDAVEDDVAEEPDADAGAGDSGSALDAYVDLEREQLDAAGASLMDIYSDVTVEPAPPSGIVYTYTYLDQVDADMANDALAETGTALEELVNSSVFPMMDQMGVESPQSATFTYLNADGGELWSETFTSE